MKWAFLAVRLGSCCSGLSSDGEPEADAASSPGTPTANRGQEPSLRYKILGRRTGLKVTDMVIGSGMFGRTWGYGAEPDEIRSILQGCVEAGGNFIDTADNYQHGESDWLIGEFVTPHRDDFVIASNLSRGAAVDPALAVLGCDRKSMVQAVENSLKRLKTDRIDLYFAHMDDGVTPIEEIARGFDDLVRAGKVVYIGLSNFAA